MKAEISVPRSVYQSAKKLANQLGVSLNDIITTALTSYLTSHRVENVTEILNSVYEDESSELDKIILQLQLSSIGEERW